MHRILICLAAFLACCWAPLGAQIVGVQVAIAGSELSFDNNHVPVVWVDGQITSYAMPGDTSFGWARQVVFHQGKKYVLGVFREDGGPSRPIIWGPDETFVLPIIPGHSDEDAVAIKGASWRGFLFSSGTVGNSGVGIPVYYINAGSMMILPFSFGMGGGLWSIAADEDVVYGGGLAINDAMRAKPSIWKYDSMSARWDLPLPDNSLGQGRVNALNIANGHLYAAGVHWVDQPNIYFPVYWRDEEAFYLAPFTTGNATGDATGIAVTATNVYVSGYMLDDGFNAKPVLWVDSVRNDLPVPPTAEGGVARDVALLGGKPLVVGAYFTPDGKSTACYWLDGKRVDLPKLHAGDLTDVSSVSIIPLVGPVTGAGDMKKPFHVEKKFQQGPVRR